MAVPGFSSMTFLWVFKSVKKYNAAPQVADLIFILITLVINAKRNYLLPASEELFYRRKLVAGGGSSNN